MAFNKALLTSNTDQWATPQWLFDKLNQQHNFELDVCASEGNAKCSRFFTKEQDSLKQRWQGRCWCNPPYGRTIGLWMEKAYKSSILGAVVVCLVPARTDTKWWNTWALKGEVEYLQGRLKFGDAKNSAPFASAIVKYLPPPPHFGIFPEIDIINEINLWGVERIPTMARWLLPHLQADTVKSMKVRK